MNASSTPKLQRGFSRVKAIISLLVVALLLAVIVYGPAAVDLYRFDQSLDKIAADNVADAGKWPQLQEVCALCHGRQGSSVNQLYASLAGQPAAYLAQQLNAFASEQRYNPTMTTLARTLSPEDIQRLADYYAAQPRRSNSTFKADPAALSQGKTLAESGGCSACHGADFKGQALFPRLAGQGSLYLQDQLMAYRSGQRKDPTGSMNALTAGMSDDDINSLAQYLASQP